MKTFAKNVFVGLVLLLHQIIGIECSSFYELDDCGILGSREDDENSKTNAFRITSEVLCKNLDLLQKNPWEISNYTNITYVTVTYSPRYFEIDETESSFFMHGSLNLSWRNEHVHWDPSKYGSLTYVYVNTYHLWQPVPSGPITPYSEADEHINYYFSESIIQSNGTIILQSTFNDINGPCQHDPRAWPFGLWKCRICLIQLYTDERIKLKEFDPLLNINLDVLRENDVWSVISIPYFTMTEFTNSSLMLSITLQRHISYYGYSLLLLCIVLFLLSLVSFWMTDRIYYRITINTVSAFVQLVILLLMVWLLRRSGSRGNALMCFLENSMFISLIGILLAAINAQLMRKRSSPPKYVMKIIDDVRILPYVGPVFHNLINGNVPSPSVFVADDVALITDFHVGDNPEWRTVRSALDKCVFILVVLYFLMFPFL